MKKGAWILVFSFVARLAFPQVYSVLLTVDTTHYIIDNHVNVRNEPSVSGSVIGQFKAGDKVTIREVTDEWYEADGVCAPWYKVSSPDLLGYVCGRYMTHKEAVGDIDRDGLDELIGCVTVSENKGTPFSAYMIDYKNWDIDHAIIKNGRVTKLNLSVNPKEEFHAAWSYSISVCDQVIPPVTFLIVAKGFGDGGGSWEDNIYYYYHPDKQFLYAFTLHECYYECDFNESNEISYRDNSLVIRHRHFDWMEDRDPPDYVETKASESRYAWFADKFLKQ